MYMSLYQLDYNLYRNTYIILTPHSTRWFTPSPPLLLQWTRLLKEHVQGRGRTDGMFMFSIIHLPYLKLIYMYHMENHG